MDIKDLKVGDVVFIREDLKYGKGYGDYLYTYGMCSGVQRIKSIHGDRGNFKVFDTSECFYTPEMIDWNKTIKIRREKMNIKDLKVGDIVYIREDLENDNLYGNNVYINDMCKGIQKIGFISIEYGIIRTVETPDYSYTPEMIDWEKTDILRRGKMNINNLKVGDMVYIREDLEHGEIYGDYMYMDDMCSGVQKIKSIYKECENFKVFGSFDYFYTPEMIDWNKTEELKTITKYSHDIVHNPSHYGGGGIHNIECYKAIEYILDRLENVPERYFGHVSNIVKYIWRCNDKNGYEDLDKASVYFDFMFREDD